MNAARTGPVRALRAFVTSIFTATSRSASITAIDAHHPSRPGD
jgi:hypothetical protein